MTEASKIGEGGGEEGEGGGGGEDVTMAGQTNKQTSNIEQGKIELLSQWTMEG